MAFQISWARTPSTTLRAGRGGDTFAASLCRSFAGIPCCVILIRQRLGIFRLRSFFASRRSYCAQDDRVRGGMGLAAELRACGACIEIRSRGRAEAMAFQISWARTPSTTLRAGPRYRSERAAGSRGLEALLPVSGPSFVVSDGYDAQYVGVIQVDDRKGKAVKHEAAGSVQMPGPALGSLGNAVESSDRAVINPVLASALRCKYQSSAASISCHARGSRR